MAGPPLDPATVLAIAGMAVATYLCRAGGYALFRRAPPTPLTRAVLGYLPGAMFVAYVVPLLARGGPQQWAGAAATLAAMAATRSIGWAIAAGVAAAWAVWLLIA